MADSPGDTAHKQLRALRASMKESPSEDLRFRVGMLAALIEIVDRLERIDNTLDVIQRSLDIGFDNLGG